MQQHVSIDRGELKSDREFLMRFARRRCHDAALAEDAVQDTFEAILSGRAAFSGRSARRTWLCAVLLHKLADALASRRRVPCLSDRTPDQDVPAMVCPRPRPEALLEQRQRLTAAMEGIAALPAGLRDAIVHRVVMDRASAVVCRTLAISQGALDVRVHRARARLARSMDWTPP
jgi:RNA polymerase sigma-70 factor (ECF subfamily)